MKRFLAMVTAVILIAGGLTVSVAATAQNAANDYFAVSDSEIAKYANKKSVKDMTAEQINTAYKEIVSKNLAASREGVESPINETFQMTDQILIKIINYGMNQDDKVKAVYDFLVYNYTKYGYNEKLPSGNKVSYDVITTDAGTLYLDIMFAYRLLISKTGTCNDFAFLMFVMLYRLNIESEVIYELNGSFFVNYDGSLHHHSFNRVCVNGKWYWYDVDMDGSMFRRGIKPLYSNYKKDTATFKKNHIWDEEIYPEYKSGATVKEIGERTTADAVVTDGQYPATLAGAKQAVNNFANGKITAAQAIAAVKAFANA